MRILITGAAGYIGSALARKLSNQDLVLVDNYSANYDNRPHLETIEGHKVLNCDFTDKKTCQEVTRNVDVVIHLGAIPGINRCENTASYQTNVIGTVLLGNCSEDNGVKKFIYSSSSAVYGESQSENIDENHRIKPRSRYGWQKYASEILLQSHRMPIVILRKSNVYGDALFHKPVAVDVFIDKAIRGDPITIDGTGQQRRDYIHIDDTVDAYIQAIYWDSGVYNIGGNDNLSVNELADLIITTIGKPVQKIYNQSGNVGRLLKKFVYNCDKAKALGFNPKRKIADEIRRRYPF